MDIHEAQQHFKTLLNSVDKSQLIGFCKWIKEYSDEVIRSASQSNDDIVMKQIQEDIRQALPQDTTMPTENIIYPTVGDNADCNPASTVHVDAFLYDDDTIDELMDAGKMSRNYCLKCGSHQVLPLTFISHSTSLMQLKYMFQFLLPDLQGKRLLDIGSRTGAVLYGAYQYSRCSEIMGVEINSEFCELQQGIINRYGMDNRVKVICADICSQPELLHAADVIIMNNVFEFFAHLDVQTRIWQFIHQHVTRSGVVLLTSPCIEDALEHLETGIDVPSWIVEQDISDRLATANMHLFGNKDSEEGEFTGIHVYTVI